MTNHLYWPSLTNFDQLLTRILFWVDVCVDRIGLSQIYSLFSDTRHIILSRATMQGAPSGGLWKVVFTLINFDGRRRHYLSVFSKGGDPDVYIMWLLTLPFVATLRCFTHPEWSLKEVDLFIHSNKVFAIQQVVQQTRAYFRPKVKLDNIKKNIYNGIRKKCTRWPLGWSNSFCSKVRLHAGICQNTTFDVVHFDLWLPFDGKSFITVMERRYQNFNVNNHFIDVVLIVRC